MEQLGGNMGRLILRGDPERLKIKLKKREYRGSRENIEGLRRENGGAQCGT